MMDDNMISLTIPAHQFLSMTKERLEMGLKKAGFDLSREIEVNRMIGDSKVIFKQKRSGDR